MRTGTESEMCMELPRDYNNWSSTVIFFKENEDDVSVYAFDSDDCIPYYVVSYQRKKSLFRKSAYAAGDFKVYFFAGEVTVDQCGEIIYPREVQVYDIYARRWVEGLPKLKHHKLTPFVFFLAGRLYVLSTRLGHHQSHFEMLDLNNPSRGWVSLSRPPFFRRLLVACRHVKIIDYSQNTFYIRLVGISYQGCLSYIFSYSLLDDKWCMHSVKDSALTARTSNLLKTVWSDSCLIVGNYLYKFEKSNSPISPAILVIHDLEDFHSNDDPPITGRWEVDISHVVPPKVLLDPYACGSLVYLGKRDSCSRFSLVISYSYKHCPEADHLCTCTFDLRRSSRNLDEATAAGESSTESFFANTICCNISPHIKVGPVPLACYKLCEVKDD